METVTLSYGAAVEVERIHRDDKPLCKLTFRDQFEPFYVWLKPGQVDEFADLLRTLGSHDYECFWADTRIVIGVRRDCIHVSRKHGRQTIERDYPLTKKQARELAGAVRKLSVSE